MPAYFIFFVLVSVLLFSQCLGDLSELSKNSHLAKLGWQPDFSERLVQPSSVKADETSAVAPDTASLSYQILEAKPDSSPALTAYEIEEVAVKVVDTAENSTQNTTTPEGATKGADIRFNGRAYGCGIHRDCLSCQSYEYEGCYWTSESGCFQLPRGVLKQSQCSGIVEVGEIKATCENYPTCESCTMQSGCVYYKGTCTYSSGPSCRMDIYNCANAPEDCPSNKVVYRPQPNPKLQQIFNDPYSRVVSYPSTPLSISHLPFISPLAVPVSPISIPSYPIRYRSSTVPLTSHFIDYTSTPRVEYIRDPKSSHHHDYKSTPLTLSRPYSYTPSSYVSNNPPSITRTSTSRPTYSNTFRNVEVNPTYLTYTWP